MTDPESRDVTDGGRPMPPPGGRTLFFIAGAGLAPGLGLVCSLFAMLYAAIARPRFRTALLLAAVPGLAVNIALASLGYGVWSQWSQYQALLAAPPADEQELVQDRLRGIVRILEYAKIVHGEYPYTLQQLEEWLPSISSFDFWDLTTLLRCERAYPGYSLARDKQSYQLFGVGPDCKPWTADDVQVVLSEEERAKVGLRMGRE